MLLVLPSLPQPSSRTLHSQHLEGLESTAPGSTSSRQRKVARRSKDTRAWGDQSPRSLMPKEQKKNSGSGCLMPQDVEKLLVAQA